jgi:O-antigen ligase
MSLAATPADLDSATRQRGRAYVSIWLKTLLDRMITVWIFLGGVIIVEPSPYEFMFALVLPVMLFAGMKVYRSTAGLFILTAIFAPFALVAAFQPTFTPIPTALVYEAVTIFLLLTAFVLANYVAEAPQERMRRIVNAYTVVAVISAIIGTAGYLHLIPGAYDLLTRYGRAKALFLDPNVFGPFLILPAAYATQRLLLGGRRGIVLNGLIVMALLVGVFVSFSRAAWASLAAAILIVFLLAYLLEADGRKKVRMLVLALLGAGMVVVAIGGLLSIPSVNHLFDERAKVAESYDSGATGRFGRQGYAFGLALNHPWGIGPGQFANLRVKEEPHDTFVTVLHVYGWGGGLCFYGLFLLTLIRACKGLVPRSPNRRLLIPLIATYVPLIVEAGIIDIDHWRHLFLIIGLIWGVTSGYKRLASGESRETALV